MQADRTADAEGGRLVAIQDGIASAKGAEGRKGIKGLCLRRESQSGENRQSGRCQVSFAWQGQHFSLPLPHGTDQLLRACPMRALILANVIVFRAVSFGDRHRQASLHRPAK